ncbi:MAG TPA: hypothetical protein VGR00_02095 [Thermoanaerobaculia bacterium]|nr:hypothetical protein [Thermoanaerobaculia bacterium]
MKRFTTGMAIVLCVAVGGGAYALGQEKQHTETTVKKTGPGPDVKTKTETVVGTVKDYEPGKKIKVEGPGGKDYSFDLDENAKLEGSVVVGQMAKVTYYKDNDGRERVKVLSEAPKGAQASASAPRVHSESTVKHKGPGPDTKATSEVVVGTVKEFEPGKKIKVTGPGDKDYTFDLDENASVKASSVAVGQRVKVTYMKGEHGFKATLVEPAL